MTATPSIAVILLTTTAVHLRRNQREVRNMRRLNQRITCNAPNNLLRHQYSYHSFVYTQHQGIKQPKFTIKKMRGTRITHKRTEQAAAILSAGVR